jgi:predicted  nucleic acid-binding Zn-ribbon protein
MNSLAQAMPDQGFVFRAPRWVAGTATMLLALAMALTLMPPPGARAESGTSQTKSGCPNCGVVRSIREVDRERPAQVASAAPAEQAVGDFPGSLGGSYPVAWMASARYGGGEGLSKGYVGAVGSPEMRQSLTEKSYEVVVKLDNGSYQLIREDELPDWQAGDRVKIVMGKIVPAQ